MPFGVESVYRVMFGLLEVDMVVDGAGWLARWFADCSSLVWGDAIYQVQVVVDSTLLRLRYLRIRLPDLRRPQSTPLPFVIVFLL